MAINLVCFLLLLFSCNNSGNKNVSQVSSTVVLQNDSLKILSNQWMEDSFGCKKIRTIESFESLMYGYSFSGKDKEYILGILGVPNEENKYKDKIRMIYYFNSVCENDKIVEESDKSSIRLTFDSKNRFQGYDTRIE